MANTARYDDRLISRISRAIGQENSTAKHPSNRTKSQSPRLVHSNLLLNIIMQMDPILFHLPWHPRMNIRPYTIHRYRRHLILALSERRQAVG